MNILQQAGLPLEMLGQVLNHNPKSDHQSTEELSETINSEITESSQNLVEHYDQVTKELTLGLAQLQEANSKQDPEVREAITQVKIELNNTNEASKFHGEEAQFGTALSNTLDANPNVFNGKPENLAKFNELLKLHIEQQSGVDSLLSATNNDDPIVKSKLAETKTGNIASRYQLLHLAKGGDLKDLDTIASLATELVAKPDNLKSHYGSVRIDLENGMDELSSAQANNDPEVKKEMTELRTEMLNTNHAQEFWGDEKKFGTQLMKELLNNPQTLNSNIFKDLVSVHSGLSGGFDELMSQGQDQNDPSVKQALADLTIENKSNSSQLLYIARGGQPNNLDFIGKQAQKTTAKTSNVEAHYDSVMNDLQNGTEELLSASGTNDPELKNALNQLNGEIKMVGKLQKFWGAENDFSKLLMKNLIKNDALMRNQQFMDNFNQLTDERNALQGRNDTLLSSSGTEDPDTKKKLEENKQALLKALGLAKPKQQTVVQNKNARV